jgi:hypothetical protein
MKKLFDNEGLETKASQEQKETENSCMQFYYLYRIQQKGKNQF